ncbi:glutathione-dependent formaldehyde dehydrogenase [Pantoea sp. Ap-967]|uniref:zinc-dependent alcohol dehydrogenase n=1 Tax=Pantoea sp. Ap-967 TaxID=2608362 RepID=UPI00141E9D9C|nr:zinc-dependent alcohol dehydrogenase [Pantoea sp. Ap-967]NIE75957.1 glutathione-dependent formaldehyde dehydrogenase [Pantoea sp. Ap-967]
MRALTYHGANDVRVDTVADPIIEHSDDIILRVTATAICGSDLHLYHGRVPETEAGDIFGHEFMGIVEDVGADVTNVKVGDRVVIPFVIACGSCFFCQHDLFAACETTNTGPGAVIHKKGIPPGAALFGYSHLYGGIPGGQADYVRVPKANVGPFKVPTTLADDKVLFLSDILPTAWQAVTNAEVGKGSSVAIYGAGPVGLLSAACARMLGASIIIMVDNSDHRLAYARDAYGVIPIHFEKDDDPADSIIRHTPGMRGVDAVIDAVGFEAKGSATDSLMTALKLEGSSGKALRQSIAAVRRGGVVSVPGVYAGFVHGFSFGEAFDKGLTFKMGQTHVQKYLPELLEHIEAGRLQPELIVTHRLALEDAAKGYKMFDQKTDNCRKVILTPGAASGTLGSATDR